MTWFILALISGLAFAVSRISARLLLKTKLNPLLFMFWHDSIAGIVALPFGIITWQWPHYGITWFYFLLVVLFSFLADWLSFIGLQTVEVSTAQILNQARHVVTLLGGWLIFAEVLTLSKVLGTLAIIIGVLIAVYDRSHAHYHRGMLATLGSGIAAACSIITTKQVLVDFSPLGLASIEMLLIALVSLIIARPTLVRAKQMIQAHSLGMVVGGGSFGLYVIFLLFALEYGEVSRVVPVTQVSLIFTLIGGILFLNERQHLIQKCFGTVIICLGIAAIYVF
jgi:drug/metabolite transporter (DMT)-like permease